MIHTVFGETKFPVDNQEMFRGCLCLLTFSRQMFQNNNDLFPPTGKNGAKQKMFSKILKSGNQVQFVGKINIYKYIMPN